MRQLPIASEDIPQKTRLRFWQHMAVPKNGCWVWRGAKFRKGYGNFHVPGVGNIGAHVVSYLLTRDTDILQPNDCVLHKCDNPPCCRPSHLFKGTKLDNTRDMIDKGREKYYGNLKNARVRRGEETSNHVLTAADVLAIRHARSLGVGQKRLAKQYGVCYQAIQAIDHGRSWKHLTTPLGANSTEKKQGEQNVNIAGDSKTGT